jgi:hypothetical protein
MNLSERCYCCVCQQPLGASLCLHACYVTRRNPLVLTERKCARPDLPSVCVAIRAEARGLAADKIWWGPGSLYGSGGSRFWLVSKERPARLHMNRHVDRVVRRGPGVGRTAILHFCWCGKKPLPKSEWWRSVENCWNEERLTGIRKCFTAWHRDRKGIKRDSLSWAMDKYSGLLDL